VQQLRERVGATIVELMDGGGTSPIVTYSVLLEESPEILDGLQAQDLIALCDDIQRSEIPEVSRRFQELFREYNGRFFAGRLPDYEVRVVYDIYHWAGSPFRYGDLGIFQPELGRILIRYVSDRPTMVSILIYEMARATTDDISDGTWLAEMRRLRKAGAPVGNIQLDWGDRS
jgi:hypothetical protein